MQPRLTPPEHSKRFILIRLAGDTPNHVHKGGSGPCSALCENRCTVFIFYDRVETVVVNRPVSASAILGYVFAHEIGHILSGVARHADRGLMRAQWASGDLHSITVRSLGFAPGDSELIRNNMKRGFGLRAGARNFRIGLTTSSDLN